MADNGYTQASIPLINTGWSLSDGGTVPTRLQKPETSAAVLNNDVVDYC